MKSFENLTDDEKADVVESVNDWGLLPAKWAKIVMGFSDGDHTKVAKSFFLDEVGEEAFEEVRVACIKRFYAVSELCRIWAEDLEKIKNEGGADDVR